MFTTFLILAFSQGAGEIAFTKTSHWSVSSWLLYSFAMQACKAAEFDFKEFNASDNRNKSSIEVPMNGWREETRAEVGQRTCHAAPCMTVQSPCPAPARVSMFSIQPLRSSSHKH